MQHPITNQVRHAVKLAVKKTSFADMARRLIKTPHPLEPALSIGRSQGWSEGAQWLLSAQGRNLLATAELLESLQERISEEIEHELLLTEVRKLLLLEHKTLLNQENIQVFATALIQQCINNQYVYYVSDAEERALEALSARLSRFSNKSNPLETHELYQLALYRDPEQFSVSWNEASAIGPLAELAHRRAQERREEEQIKHSIEQLVPLKTPHQVAEMYEENPYPRWLNMRLRKPGSRIEAMRKHFSDNEFPSSDRTWDILAAGCGTGRDVMAMASGYGDQANVLAIDFSRASLAYAIRMSNKYGNSNIRFAQCDIRDLPKLPDQFDIIESSGVLHHLDDPMEGWRALVDRLRPGGLMYIALYSRLARREIIRIRDDVASRGGVPDAKFIRSYRQELMLNRPQLIDGPNLPNRWDFFSMSGCKDLLFHVVEHQYTIPELGQCLKELGLEFRGFELPGLLQDRFWSKFPDGHKWLDLEAWAEFEQAHPNTFGSLYSFWCRKPLPSKH